MRTNFLTCPGTKTLLLVGVAPSSPEEPICWMMPASSAAGSAPRTCTWGRKGGGGEEGGGEEGGWEEGGGEDGRRGEGRRGEERGREGGAGGGEGGGEGGGQEGRGKQ